MPCAIEIGDFMYEHASSEKLVPIISVTLDHFGNVVPVRLLNKFKDVLSRKIHSLLKLFSPNTNFEKQKPELTLN